MNLVAWSQQLRGHLIPHAAVPASFTGEGVRFVTIEQNAVRLLRHEVLTTFDPRRAPDVSGKWMRVRRERKSLFEEDKDAPLYFSETDLARRRLRSVYISPRRPYWIECCCPGAAPSDSVFEHFQMLSTWIRRASPVFDKAVNGLPNGPIELQVHFAEILGTTWGNIPKRSEAELRSILGVEIRDNAVVHINVGVGFDDGLKQAENVAERLMVEMIVAGVSRLSQPPLGPNEQILLVSAICPAPQARCLHRFEARVYRDFISSDRLPAPILVDEMDGAMYKFGLGWKARSKNLGPEILGAEECKAFLNTLVATVLDDLCSDLKRLDRRQLIEFLLRNHEAIECDRARWRRTAGANIAMHDDSALAIRTIVDREGTLTAAAMACRILIEAGICECPVIGGYPPGELDLTRLMAQALIAYHWGAYSDVIHWGSAEARLRITPLGDVHFNPEFMDNIYEPFGRESSERNVRQAAQAYPGLFTTPEPLPSVIPVIDAEFLSAWESEFGVSVDQLRLFFELLENRCRTEGNEAVIFMPRPEVALLLMESASVEEGKASRMLQPWVSLPRLAWRTADLGFTNKDWFPWRFRRRYATLRRPFLQLENHASSELAFAPGLAHQC